MQAAARRQVAVPTLLLAAAAVLVATWSLPAPARAALPPQGFVATPMTSTYDDPFAPSPTGNPVTDGGLVAGSTEVGRYSRAAVYDLNRHTLRVLGTLGGRSSWGTDVNAAGDVVGYSDLPNLGETHAFVWTARTGVMRDLGAFDGRGDYSQANAINDAGVVVGWGNLERPGTTPRAFVWDPHASPVRMRELPLPAGTRTSMANAINTRGQVVGRATGDTDEGFLWDPATARSSVLGPLAGLALVTGAADINDRGFVVGPAEVSRTGPSGTYVVPRSYLWNPTTRSATLLVTAPGSTSADDQARAINRYGIIVGVATRDDVRRLAVWNACATPVFLQPATTPVYAVTGVNRYGRIVGIVPRSLTGGVEWNRAGPCG